MSSRRRSKINPFPEARNSSAFWSRIFIKDFVCCLPEFQIISCVSNILNKISSKDLPMVCFVVTQHSESELSLCLRYSKTSSLQATPKKIHGSHGEHGKRFSLKIILKIFIQISSRKAIHNKVLPRSEELERILVRDFC